MNGVSWGTLGEPRGSLLERLGVVLARQDVLVERFGNGAGQQGLLETHWGRSWAVPEVILGGLGGLSGRLTASWAAREPFGKPMRPFEGDLCGP